LLILAPFHFMRGKSKKRRPIRHSDDHKRHEVADGEKCDGELDAQDAESIRDCQGCRLRRLTAKINIIVEVYLVLPDNDSLGEDVEEHDRNNCERHDHGRRKSVNRKQVAKVIDAIENV